ncbi:HIT domain-containing protein [Maribrevibacterium harenarium]|uniref:HIT domain-containing protein n=1 Tax=Maribrevibacterium harenarium TaxID=2589817 RepID=A0A501WR97_9GAMM|nr:HIT family protein [Maribrevibacterium harenarium]TPE51989.1 HIT domain-containing protein [Maribrevibacterium harenarium]
MFELNEVLARDSIFVGSLPLSDVRLINDSQFPWLILVPRRDNVSEIYQLHLDDRQQLMAESCQVAEIMAEIFAPDKLNIAVIGNKVRQLHFHHIARYASDALWPEPVWGKLPAKPYASEQLANLLQKLQQKLPLEQ